MPAQADQLRYMAATVGDEVAYVDLIRDESMTFAEWDRGANRLARGLTRAKVQPGDRVALHVDAAHALRWLIAYPAIHRAGAVAVPTNTRLTRRELDSILGHAKATAVITSSELVDLHAGRDVALMVVDDGWDDLLDDDGSTIDHGIDDDDLADVVYTSGTTGLPKGIAVRHRNAHIIPNGEPKWTGDAWLHALPMFTFAGISFVYNPMKMGMRGLYLSRFDVDTWIDTVETRRPTSAFLVPAMVQLLLNSPRLADADLSSLSLVSIGSAPLPPSLHLAFADLLPDASVSNNYSMTEAGTAFTFLPKEELHRRVGSVGVPIGTEIRIVDEEGDTLPAGEIGEVLIRVGERHREYYANPEATAATWSGDWLRSGDLGELDADGYLYIRGRKKDMIIRGGHNIVA
ncbi:MAG TPA: AMP-binding protein, partial [Microthrixaceae bacterium]|nr:AMP-binding protein [Microthrixaceae bacterium]